MKVQSVTLDINEKESFPLSMSDIGVLGSGFLWGFLSNHSIAIGMVTILIAYFYHRSSEKTLYCGAGYLIGSLWLGPWNCYFNAILLCIFALMIAFVRLLRGNLYTFFPIMTGLISLISSVVIEQQFISAFYSMMLGYVICLYALKHMNVAQKVFRVNSIILGILLMGSFGLASLVLPSPLEVLWVILIFAVLSQIVEMSSLILLMLSCYGLVVMPQYAAGWIVGAILCNCTKECGKGAQLFSFVLPLVLASGRIDVVAIAIVLFILSSGFSQIGLVTLLETSNEVSYERQQLASKERLLEHQLTQFAAIFYSISQFFGRTQKSESTFLEGMAKSMELLSTQLKQSASYAQDETTKIYNLLKGYNYSINRVHVQENAVGQKNIILHFDDCSKIDVEEVIVPLLQMVVDKNLSLLQFTHSRFLQTSVKVELGGTIPLQLKARAFKVRKMEEASGDTCALFQYKQNTICTISDGMGSGTSAQRSSSFITQLTQRLIAAGIPVEMAVKSMNSLLRLHQEESFATLDILVFDALAKQAFLSKSGACATFLVRNHQVLKVQGESLPLGIIQQVEADCYRMDCMPEDVFVMCSDGVDEASLEKWLMEHPKEEYAEVIENELAKLEINDDATVLLAEVFKR